MSNHSHEQPNRYQEAEQLTKELVGVLEERIVASGVSRGIVKDVGNEDFGSSEVAIYRLGLKYFDDNRYIFEQHVNVKAGTATYTAKDISERPGKIIPEVAVLAPSESLFVMNLPGSNGVQQTNVEKLTWLYDFIKTADVIEDAEIEQSLKPVDFSEKSKAISEANNKRRKGHRAIGALGRVAGSIITGSSKEA